MSELVGLYRYKSLLSDQQYRQAVGKTMATMEARCLQSCKPNSQVGLNISVI